IIRVAQHPDEGGEPAVVHDPLPGGGGVEVGDVDDAGEGRVLLGHGADGVGQVLADLGGLLADVGPPGVGRDVEAGELVVLLDELRGRARVAEVLGEVGQLIVENVGQALEEDEWEDVVLELGGVERPADDAGGLPEPRLQGGQVEPTARAFGEGQVLLAGVVRHGRLLSGTIKYAPLSAPRRRLQGWKSRSGRDWLQTGYKRALWQRRPMKQ